MNDPRTRLSELDALRGMAAMAVLLFHYTGHAVRYFHDFPFYWSLGNRGVQLFFGISGFVIFWTLDRSSTLADFAYSRVTRLYPTYWLSLMLVSALSLAVGNQFWPG